MRFPTLLVALALAFHPLGGAHAQELASRVATVGTGTVLVTYPSRPDAEICDQGIRIGGSRVEWRGRGRSDFATSCTSDWIEIELEIANGVVQEIDVLDSDEMPRANAVDLGQVTADAAARYLLDLAQGSGTPRSGEDDAIFAAILADVDELWRDLLVIARDRQADGDVRAAALFWLGQDAAAAATADLAALADDEREEQDVRDAAVFALSQRPTAEALPVLLDLARTAREAETRKSAMFWLAQSDDERVLAFFEEVLLGRQG